MLLWRDIATNLTLTDDAVDPYIQWVAVTTQRGSIKEPPQNCLPLLSSSIACQGQLLFGAMVPPTIRELPGRDPHETGKKVERIDNHRYSNTFR